MKKRLICLVVALSLILGSLPFSLMAEDTEPTSLLKKTAEWVDGEKENLRINLESADATGRLNGKVLFLGSLCGNHTLSDDNIKTAIGVTAMYADVDYFLFQTTKTTFTPSKSFSGTIEKTGKFTIAESIAEVSKNPLFNTTLLAGSMHHTGYDFANVLMQKAAAGVTYDYIIMEFDGFLLTEYDPGKSPYDVPAEQTALLDAAAPIIKEYYAKNKVLWIVPPIKGSGTGSNMYYDNKFDGTGNTTASVREITKLLAPEDLNASGQVKSGKLNTQTTLYNRITETDADKKIWTTYGDGDGIADLLQRKFGGIRYKKVDITDTVNDGFIVDGVTGYIYNETTKKWENAGAKFTTTWQKGDKLVKGSFKVEDISHTLVKMVIDAHVDNQNDPFKKTIDHTADTNKGDATAEYYTNDDEPRDTYKAPPPKLKRYDCTITTKVINGTMAAKVNDKTPADLNSTDSVVVKDHDGLTEENDVLFTYAPNQYCELDYIKIDGTTLTPQQLETYGSSYSFEDVVADHSIEVAYKYQKIKVDFNTHGATSETPATQEIDKGSTPTKPADPTKPGYTFKNWTTDEQGNNEFHFIDDPQEAYTKDAVIKDTTLHGQYTENDVTITYSVDSTGGGKVMLDKQDAEAKATDSETVKADTSTPVGAIPVPDTGYSFNKWEKVSGPAITSSDVDSVTKKITPPKNSDKIYENAEYRAFFTINNFAVQFENYGIGTKPQEQSVDYNGAVTDPGDLTSDKYIFAGWYADPDYTTPFVFDGEQNPTLVTEPITIYAKWNVTLNYVSTDTDLGTVTVSSETFDIRHPEVIGSTGEEKLGCSFVNWTDKETGGSELSTNAVFMPPEPQPDTYYQPATYYCNFMKAPITITYVVKEGKGTVGGKDKVEVTTNAVDGDQSGCLAAPAEHYSFVNWSDASGNQLGTSLLFKPSVNGDGIYEEATYYANFKADIYNVTFVMNGHGEQVAPQKVEYNNKATKPATPTEDGYKFITWYADESLTEEFNFNTPIVKDTILYANWEVVVEFLDPTGPETPSENEELEVGEKAVEPHNTAEGYDFEGWYIDPERTIPFDPDVPITKPTKVYSKWVEKSAPLHYDLNGGVSDIKDDVMKYTASTDVSALVPTKENSVFKGWATTKERAAQGLVDFEAGVNYKGKNIVPAEATLYAVWGEVASPKTFDSSDYSIFFPILMLSLAVLCFGSAIVLIKKKKGN